MGVEKEEIKTEGKEIASAQAKTQNANAENISAGKSFLEEAREIAARLEKANAESKSLLIEKERLMAMETLGGKTEAGYNPVKKELTPQEYANLLREGKLNPFT